MEEKTKILIKEPEEIIEPKNPNKIKYTAAIISATVILATVATLLIGHFQFSWFKDTYRLDANISRKAFQANYFSEQKTVSTKFSFTNGVIQEKEYILNTDFVVFLTNREENENKKFFNTAILILLDSKMIYENGEKNLPHLNIFDEAQLKELESNPEGAKYPIAVFKFNDDGEIKEIIVPKNLDEYNTETLNELIEKVVPKLSRNKTEDISKGLQIETSKNKNKRTIVQKESPKQFYSFRNSQYSKLVKTDIEDEQISKIETDSNVQLKSVPENGELVFGPKEFNYNIKSDIVSKEVKYDQKENTELVKKIAEKFEFIDSKELLKQFKDEKEEENKPVVIEKEKEPEPELRKLGFNVKASKTFNLASFNVAGISVSIKYYVEFTSSTAVNKIILTSGGAKIEFGNTGFSGTYKREWSYKQPIFTFPFPGFPAVSVGAFAEGSLKAEVGVKSGSGSSTKYFASLTGKLTMGAEIKAGWDAIASLSAGAEGTVAEASASVIVSNGSVSKDSGFSLKMGALEAYIKGCLFTAKIEIAKFTIYKGWAYA